MYAGNFMSPLFPRGLHQFRPAASGLAIDTHNVGHHHHETGPNSHEINNSVPPLSRRNSQQQQWQGTAAMHGGTSAVSQPQAVRCSPYWLAGAVPLGLYTKAAGIQDGKAEPALVTVLGHITTGCGSSQQHSACLVPPARHGEPGSGFVGASACNLKDEEDSADKEDSADEDWGDDYDMVMQQAVNERQTTIWHLTMECNMKPKSPSAATRERCIDLLFDFGRMCAANHHANRHANLEYEQLLNERKVLLQQRMQL